MSCVGQLPARPSCHAGVPAERSAMSVLRGWVWVWAAWAFFHTFLLCHALAEPKAAVFGGVPIIDEKGKRKYYHSPASALLLLFTWASGAGLLASRRHWWLSLCWGQDLLTGLDTYKPVRHVGMYADGRLVGGSADPGHLTERWVQVCNEHLCPTTIASQGRSMPRKRETLLTDSYIFSFLWSQEYISRPHPVTFQMLKYSKEKKIANWMFLNLLS